MPPFEPLHLPFATVVFANGDFPSHPVPLALLGNAEQVVCCDGAAEALLRFGKEPDCIAGDMDSLSPALQERFRGRIHHDPDQTTNDLTKAVMFCVAHGWTEITILGATGRREDHTIANIALLARYALVARVRLATDYGTFVPVRQTTEFESYVQQQISVFSLTPTTLFTFRNLKYPVVRTPLQEWWQGSLNEASGTSFTVEMDQGIAVVFREHGKTAGHKKIVVR
ncbi:MAG: thiamine diphosphokinase [Bacteroidales bacterium]|jgi:thiamine pyrophosphokinase|nr:thiamine diphosphokinase [Bacteroidales bacterium]